MDKERPVRGESAIVAAWLDWRSVDPTDDEYATLQKYLHSEAGACPPRDMLMRVRRSMKPFLGALGVYDMTGWQLWLTDVKSERDLKDPQPYNPSPSPQPSLLASTSNSSQTGPMLSTVTPEPGSASRSATPPAHREDIIDTRTPARRPSQKTSLSALFSGFKPGRIDPTQQQAWTVASVSPTSPVPMPPTSPTSTNIFRKPTMHPPSMLSPTTAMEAANNTASRGGSMPTIKELIREQTMRLHDKIADLRGRSASGPLTVEPGDPHRPGSTASRQPNLDNDTPQPPAIASTSPVRRGPSVTLGSTSTPTQGSNGAYPSLPSEPPVVTHPTRQEDFVLKLIIEEGDDDYVKELETNLARWRQFLLDNDVKIPRSDLSLQFNPDEHSQYMKQINDMLRSAKI